MKSSGDFQAEKIYHNRWKLNFSFLFWTLLQAEKGRKNGEKTGVCVKKRTSILKFRIKITFFPLDINYNTNLYGNHQKKRQICIVRMDEIGKNE